MPNEEFTQKKEALSENDLDGVSGGFIPICASPKLGAAVIVCPACESPTTVPAPEGGYRCLACGATFGQNQYQTNFTVK